MVTHSIVLAQQSYVAPGHDRNHHWYQTLQANGLSCCDEKRRDCGPVDDYKDILSGGAEVLLEDNKWYFAKTDNKFYVDTPDGKAHVCRRPATNGGFTFYCIFLPKGYT